jgi:3-carboxymethyl-3-hydroxy-acyl-[acp] dehydratase
MSGSNNYQTLRVRWEEQICFLQLYRPDDNNTINDRLIRECTDVVQECETRAKILVLEGLDDVFCFGLDFKSLAETDSPTASTGPQPLYDLWLQIALGSFVSVAHVRGRVNAGGVGFVAACDLVLADNQASFSLSELLFGLMPACVLPFLIRKIGFQKAHYLTLMTKPVDSQQAQNWGLVDVVDEQSERLLRQHISRLKCLSKTGITRYKRYMNGLADILSQSKESALAANIEVFSDPNNLEGISRYIETGQFPWET